MAASLYFDYAISLEQGPARDEAVAGARQAFSSTRKLLEGMLDHLRLEAGAERPRMQEFDIGKIVSNAVKEQSANCLVAGIALKHVPFEQIVVSDPNLVARILSNLICNAIKHANGQRILVGAARRSGWIKICVIDDGCGIPERDADRIFDDYVQVGQSRVDGGGFGLGLASSKRMASLLQGSLDVDRQWKKGSAFVLSLPISAGEVPRSLWN